MTFLCNMIQNLIQASKSTEQFEPYYEVLESITFTGDEYFDTEGYGNQNTTWEVECRATDTSNYGVVLGARTATNQNRIDLIYNNDGTSGWIGFGTNNYNTYNFKNLPANVRHNFKCDEGKVYIDGGLKTTISHTNFGTPTTIKIGCEDTNGTLSMGFVGELYVLKLNGSDYVPVLDNQMRPCLYNRTTKTFTYAKKISDGTTTYDLEFKRWNKFDVDYISSSGTEYITTNIFPDQDTAIECTARIDTWGYSPTQYPTYHSTNVFGAGSDSNTNAYTFGIGTPDTLTMGRRGGVAITGMNASLNTKYVIYQDKNGASYNGISLTYASTPSSVKATTNPLTFFRNPLSNTIGNLSMYGARVWQSGVLILDFHPVVWHNSNTTAVACMYDEVYNKMHTNAGTGSFKAYIVGADDTVYEVGSNCFVTPTTASQQVTNNYFNTGLYGNNDWNVKLIAFTSTNVAGQLFGNFISASATNNLTINSGTATGTGTISRFDGQAMSQDKIINMGANSKSLLQINKIGAWQDNTQIVAWNNPNSFTTSGTCYLCGTNGSATVRPNGCCYLAIDEDGTLVAEYIPVKNKGNTSQTGLYDRVSGTLNTGVGTINFNALD